MAAGFSRKEEIAAKAKEIGRLGVEVTSTWPQEQVAGSITLDQLTDDYLIHHAALDIAQINEADTIILFTQDPKLPFCRGGRMHEFGYAHAAGKRLIVCGPRENIFHHLPTVTVFSTWEELLRGEPWKVQ